MGAKVLTVKVVGNDSSARKAMHGIGAEAHKTGGIFSELKHHAVALAAGFVGFELLHKGAEFLKEATEAAKEDEAALALLKNQSNAAGVSWKKHGEEIEETITKMSEASGFMKSDLINAFSKLVTSTHSAEKSTELLNTAQDVARARHVDLATASQIMIKANMGNVGALKKLGIEVKAVTTHQDALKKAHDRLVASGHTLTQSEKEQYDQAMKDAKAQDKHATAIAALHQIHKSYAGASKAYSETAAGQLAKLAAKWELIKVEVGNHILPLLGKFAAFLTDELPKGFEWLKTKIDENRRVLELMGKTFGIAMDGIKAVLAVVIENFGTFTTAIKIAAAAIVAYMVITKTVAIAQALWTELTAAIWLVRNAQLVLNLAMEANPIGLIIVLVAALTAGFILAYQHSDTFRAIVDKAFKVIKQSAQSALNWITDVGFPAVMRVWEAAQPVVGALAKIVKLHFDAIKFAIQSAISIIVPLIHGDFGGAIDAAKTVVGKLKDKVVDVFKDVVKAIKDAGPDLLSEAEKAGGKILSGIKTGLGDIGGWLLGKLKAVVNYVIDQFNSRVHIKASVSVLGKDVGVDIDPPDIPHLARGGITRGPTLALVGDNPGGREAIIPLNKNGSVPGSGNVFNIYGAQDLNPMALAAKVAWLNKSVPA